MNKIHLVFDSLKYKKSDEFCSNMLEMDLEEYRKIKNRIIEIKSLFKDDMDDMMKDILTKHFLDSNSNTGIVAKQVAGLQATIEEAITLKKEKVIEQKVDIDKGTAEIKGIAFVEPQTPEEIIRMLKIDTSKWKLSTYWNKQQPGGYWLISALVTALKSEVVFDLKKALDELQLVYIPVTATHINTSYSDNTCAVISLQDIHVAKKDIGLQGDVEKDVKACIQNLITRTYHSCKLDKIIFVLGGDLINMDTYLGTTTAGTVVENSMSAVDAFKLAYEIMFWSVNYLKQFCNELEVIYIPGNHSRLSEAHIAYSLSRQISDPHIIWNIEYAEFKVISYGISMLCFEHGDHDTKKSFMYFSTKFPEQWGKAVYRICYTGHLHKEKKIEYITTDELNGFTLRILPSLSNTDHYHEKNKWTNNKRGGIVELHSETRGPSGTFSYYE